MLRVAVRPKVASKGCGDGAGPQGRASPRFPQGPAVPGCGLLSLPLPAFPEEAEGPPPGSTHKSLINRPRMPSRSNKAALISVRSSAGI